MSALDRILRALSIAYDYLSTSLGHIEKASGTMWHATHVALAWVLYFFLRWCPHRLRLFCTCRALFYPERRIALDEDSLAWRYKTCRVCKKELSRRTSQQPPPAQGMQ